MKRGRRSRLCVVCLLRPASIIMCDLCGRSYDRDAARDATIAAVVVWAARRARRFALARGKGT